MKTLLIITSLTLVPCFASYASETIFLDKSISRTALAAVPASATEASNLRRLTTSAFFTSAVADEGTSSSKSKAAPENESLESPSSGSDADDPRDSDERQRIERWLMLCCGLPGDEEHRERLTNACRKIIAAAEPVLGVSVDRLRVLAGDEQMQQDLSEATETVDVCTKKTVKSGLADLSEQVPKDGACWVVMLGHAHLYGRRSQFNVLEADFDQKQFAEWAKPLTCREQVFLVTIPVSGFWLKPLRAPSRVVITATEADLEYTGTELPYALGDILAGEGEHASLEDIDRDKSISLLDLYLAVNLEIHGRFKAMERLQTEHALLDDNGDGRGSELQLPYLPADEEDDAGDGDEVVDSVAELPEPVSNRNMDGYRSRHILLTEPNE